MQNTMCEECGETGHSANKCPIRPCNACGLRTHKLPTSHLCPEHVCTLCNGEEEPKGHSHNICPRAECQTCKLFGHVAKDCAYANCLDVEEDWFNILFTKCESIVNAYFTEFSIKRRLPISTPFVVCDLMKLTQGQRSCRPTFGGVYHRRPSLRIMQASFQPTALPRRALPQLPAI